MDVPERPSDSASSSLNADVFVSYARADREFVQLLYDALRERGVTAWVDWEGIPPSAVWMAKVRDGIDGAGAFCFVISPDSVESPACREEVAHAAVGAKRIVPVLRREVTTGLLPDAVSAHNWIRCTRDDDLDLAVTAIVEAITTDPERVKAHTRLLVRANDWESSRRNRSLLLRGSELEAAERSPWCRTQNRC